MQLEDINERFEWQDVEEAQLAVVKSVIKQLV